MGIIICEDVWRDLSNYIDDELDSTKRTAMEQHFAECAQCAAILEGTCNVIRLYRDERTLSLPKGFQERLERRLQSKPHDEDEKDRKPLEMVHLSRRKVLAWALTAAAAVPLGFALFSVKKILLPRTGDHPLWTPDSQPPSGLVAVSQDAAEKWFHIPNCPHLLGKPKFVPVEEALREGYAPCPYCIGKRLPAKRG